MREPLYDCIFIEPTNVCNFHCAFCPNARMERKRGFMDLDLAARLLDEIARENLCRYINLYLLGEPMMHPEIVTLARLVVERGLPCHLFTNYSLLDDERLEQLLTLPIDHLTLSLQTPDEDSFGLKGAGSHFSWKDNLTTLRKAVLTKFRAGSRTEIAVHLLSTSLERPGGVAVLESARDRLRAARRIRGEAEGWARDLGLRAPPAISARDVANLWMGAERRITLLPGVALYFKRATIWANALLVDGTWVEPREQGTCQLALDTLAIHWDGKVTQCCLDYDGVLAFGDASKTSLQDVIADQGYQRRRRAFADGRLTEPFCQQCRGEIAGPNLRTLVPGSLPTLVGEGQKYLRRFGLRRTARRLPQELRRYLRR